MGPTETEFLLMIHPRKEFQTFAKEAEEAGLTWRQIQIWTWRLREEGLINRQIERLGYFPRTRKAYIYFLTYDGRVRAGLVPLASTDEPQVAEDSVRGGS